MSFEVRGLTAEILEAGIIVQGYWQGLHTVSRGWAIPKGAEKKTRAERTNVLGRIEESIKSIFLGEKKKVLKSLKLKITIEMSKCHHCCF